MKLTKVIATIGPVTDSEEMIEKLILAGVNIFRFNFKHNTVEWHAERIERVNNVACKMGAHIGTLIDLQGPEIRINMPYDQMELHTGDKILLGEAAFEKKAPGFSISHPDIIQHLEEGQKLVADDGAFTFHVEKLGNQYYLDCDNGGILKQRKSLNIPGADFPFPVLIERDFDGLELAQKNEVDYVALSFVRSAEDMRVVKREMDKYGFKAKTAAKIETALALHDIDAIIDETDAIMIARGDLGVELPIEQVPYYQKVLIKKCVERGKPVITATQMLQTMMDVPYPTRAEVSDIANACYDLTDCVMLSGETASGKYPLQTVDMMVKTVKFNEHQFPVDVRKKYDLSLNNQSLLVADSVYSLYLQLQAQKANLGGILVFTQTGSTALIMSRYRPLVPIFAACPTDNVADSMTMLFGVVPFIQEMDAHKEITAETQKKALDYLKEKQYIKEGQQIIVIHRDYWNETADATVKVMTA